MKTTSPTAIQLSLTPEVKHVLKQAKKRYPALSDPEILKVGLSKIVTESSQKSDEDELREIRAMSAHAAGEDYLNDPAEDIYHLGMGRKINP